MKRLVISIAMVVLPMLIFGQECFTNGTEWKTKITTPGYPQKDLIKIEKTGWHGQYRRLRCIKNVL